MVRTVHGGLHLRRIIFFADHVPPETDRDEIPCGSDDLVGSTGVGDHLVRGSGNRPCVYRRLRERQSLTAESEIFCCLSGYGDVRVGRRRAPVYVEQAT